MLEQARHAIVTAGAAGDGDFDESEIDVEIIINGGNRRRLYLVESGQRTDRSAALVHERQRLHQPARPTTPNIPARDFRIELRRVFPSQMMFPDEGIEHHPAEIVAGGFVIAAR